MFDTNYISQYLRALFYTVLTGLLFACGNPITAQTSDNEKVQIRYLTFETNLGQVNLLRSLVKKFNEHYPNIEVLIEPNADAARVYMLDAAAGIPPDVVYLDISLMPSLVDNDVLEPLDQYITNDKIDINDYYSQVVDKLRLPETTGPLYAFPIHFSTDAIFYNEEIFDKANIPYPDSSWDWNKFFEVASQLVSKPDKNGYREVFGCLSMETQLLLESFDAPIYDYENDQYIVNNKLAIDVMRMNRDITGNQGPSIAECADNDDITLFCNGRLAMYIGRTWQLPEIDRRVGKKMRWDVAEVPKGAKRFVMLAVGGNAISRMSKHKDAAWKFVKFYSSRAGLETISKESKNCVPAMKSLATDPEYFLSPPPKNIKVFVDAVNYAGTTSPNAIWAPEIGATVWLPYQNNIRNRLPGWSPEEGMKRIQDDSNAIIAKRKAMAERKKAAMAKDATAVEESQLTGAATNFVFAGISGLLLIAFVLVAIVCRKDKRKWEGYSFISPWIIGFCVFTLGPIIFSLYLSFCEYDIFSPPRFIGIENFSNLVHDPIFHNALYNTIYFSVFVIPLSIIFSLSLAMLVNTKLPGAYTFRAIFYLPALTSGVAIALLWRWIFNPQLGLLNTLLNFVGLHGLGWLTDPNWALNAVIIMSIWSGLGGMMLIFLAGLQGIPSQLYEAADIDGAGPWMKFWHVTRPMLSPTIFFNLIISIINSFQVFSTVFVMTSANGIDVEPGGPAGSTMVYILYLYQTGFKNLYMGKACAMAWILFLIIVFLAAINAWFSKRWVHYDQS